ncbi:HNH endonuclease [Pseudomonas sp. DSV-1]|uniref:HNH endonuclease n=1 Tax=Pseudomonas sp. DSV-1 TaxID=3112250 RepID=UPI002DB9BAA4|nr:HNH endonuclease [Pseudomonas sp. DSV-1]MEC4238525.1 HNH endonuclease [Pseudomonas sp. DSV-1]
MKKLADPTSIKVLERLEKYIAAGSITASQAWSVFSKADGALKSDKKETKISARECESINKLKEIVKSRLKSKISGRCAYCKRVMGQHGMSWHIEHIKGKTKNPEFIFDMDNLTYACIDCNYTKSSSIDRPNISHLIINPNSESFQYNKHIRFIHIATENLHYLRYTAISDEGTFTYTELAFERLELIELVTSLNPIIKDIAIRIDTRVDDLDDSDESLKDFMMALKDAIT